MERLSNTRELGSYNTAINVIGGLRNCSVILKAIDSHFSSSDSLKELVNQRNEFNLRTEKCRTRIEREVRKAFLQFQNEDHQEFIRGVFSERVPQRDKDWVLIWQFALNNRLFREITSGVFVKTDYSGWASISKDDIIAYLKVFLRRSEPLQISWSENTINTLSTKYLNLMSKLGFLSPGRVKLFRHIIIYKWSRDALMRLRSVYIEHRERSLVNRQSDLSGNESADAQNEKDRIFRQLTEIEAFKSKIDELLTEGYNPILDDGVGKNIAPLQKKKLIPYEVLNAGQFKKYLNADW